MPPDPGAGPAYDEPSNAARARDLAAVLRAAGVGAVMENAPLAPLVRWRIGGPADLLVDAADAREAALVIRMTRERGLPLFILGDGSNVLMDSRGFRGVVLRIAQRMAEMRFEGRRVICGAGLWAPRFALELARRGLTGLEHIAGIPGRLGGLVLMNGGSQRKGVGAHVLEVVAVGPDGEARAFDRAALAFSYRQSALQGAGCAIVETTLELEFGDASAIRREMLAILVSRKKRFPKNLPNCGSTFLSNPAMYEVIGPPGRAIEEAGLKGLSLGGAQVSPQHANFLVNRGGATSDEILGLIDHIRRTVYARTGYWMDCEARFVSAEGEERPAHEFTDAGRFDRRILERLGRG